MYNYYKLLGIPKNASSTAIRAAYKKLAKEYHPDRNRHLPKKEILKKQEYFAIITNGYGILKDPIKRKKYDNSFVTKSIPKKDTRGRRPNSKEEFLARKKAAQERIKNKERLADKKFIQFYEKRTKYISHLKIQIILFLLILWFIKTIVVNNKINYYGANIDFFKIAIPVILVVIALRFLINNIYQKDKYNNLVKSAQIDITKRASNTLILSIVITPIFLFSSIVYRNYFLLNHAKTETTYNYWFDSVNRTIIYKADKDTFERFSSNIPLEALRFYNSKTRKELLNIDSVYVLKYSTIDPRIIEMAYIKNPLKD